MTTDGNSATTDSSAELAPTPEPLQRLRLIGVGHRGHRRLGRWRALLISTMLITTVGWFANLIYCDYLPDRHTNQAAAHDAIKAASDGVVALLSYSPDTLNHDIEDAKSRLDSHFQPSFQKFAEQVVTPAAQRGQLTTIVHVIRAATTELRPESAVVLVFFTQKTTTKEKSQTVDTTGAVRIHLTRSKTVWLISKLDSV